MDNTNHEYNGYVFTNSSAQEGGLYFSDIYATNVIRYATNNPNFKI